MVIARSGSVKRFGARYGRKPKHKLAQIEALQKAVYTCPSCDQKKVKRISSGIWQCRKCNTKFAGKAYTVSKKIVLKDQEAEEEDGSV